MSRNRNKSGSDKSSHKGRNIFLGALTLLGVVSGAVAYLGSKRFNTSDFDTSKSSDAPRPSDTKSTDTTAESADKQ